MVLQYKLKKGGKWKDYPGKKKFNKENKKISDYIFRLLTHNRKKVLVEKGSYNYVLKRMRQIEFFKNK